MNDKKKCLVVMLGFLTLLGTDIGGFQQVLLKIAEEYSLSYSTMSSLVTYKCIANFICVMIFGTLSDRLGKKPVLLCASAVYILGTVTAIVSKNFALTFCGIIAIGMSFGLIEGLPTAILADVFSDNKENVLTLSQAFCSFGAVIGPVLTSLLMNSVWKNWRILFMLLLLFMIMLFFSLMRVKIEKVQKSGDEGSSEGSVKKSFSFIIAAVIGLLILCMIIYSGFENGFGYYIDTIFERVYNRANLSSFALSGFWLAMLVSRLICSIIKKNQKIVVFIGFIALFAFSLKFFFTQQPGAAVALCLILGFACGPVWPMLISFAVEQYEEKSGAVTSCMTAASAIGASVFTQAMGNVSDAKGSPAYVSLALSITVFVGVVLFAVYLMMLKKGEN